MTPKSRSGANRAGNKRVLAGRHPRPCTLALPRIGCCPALALPLARARWLLRALDAQSTLATTDFVIPETLLYRTLPDLNSAYQPISPCNNGRTMYTGPDEFFRVHNPCCTTPITLAITDELADKSRNPSNSCLLRVRERSWRDGLLGPDYS